MYVSTEHRSEAEVLDLFKLFVDSESRLDVPLTAILAKLKAVDIHHNRKELEAPFENNALITRQKRWTML